MIKTSRRNFLGASAVISLAPAPISAQSPEGETIRQDLFRYLNFGNKQAGGDGDVACGNWLASELAKAGYAVERQYYQVPFFEPLAAELECEGGSVPVYPQPVVVPTGAGGLAGPLVRVDGYGQFAGSMKGAIALVDLPHARWSSILAPAARTPIEAAFAAGASAAVVITNGPSGKVIALNADGRGPMFAGPVALLAPDRAKDFLAAAMTRSTAPLARVRRSISSAGWIAARHAGWQFPRRVPAGSAAPPSAVPALPPGSNWRAGRRRRCRITISPSSATPAMNINISGRQKR